MTQGTVKQLRAKKNVLKETPCPRCKEDHTLVSCPEVRCITIAEDDYNVWISVEFVPEKEVYISVAKQWKEELGVDEEYEEEGSPTDKSDAEGTDTD